jgi:homogentisate phytyltransferase/homogentisate geranylgeranyltransferase
MRAVRLCALWEFARPHTLIGTALAVCALYVLATHAAGRQDPGLWAVVLVASLAVNVYVVGLNQLTDVDIDRISKPYLPLAAGSIRRVSAVAIVAAAGVAALVVAGLQGRYLFAAIAIVFLIGTMYSLPPVRLKRFPFSAAASIVIARAVVANIGVYLAYSATLTGQADLPGYVLLLVAFMFGFAVVIAVMKDVPDVEGDRSQKISTLVLAIGAARTLRLCRIVLTVCYAGVILAGLVGVPGVQGWVLVVTHTAALTAVWVLGARVDSTDRAAVHRYYMFVWKLFYFEFLAFPLAVLLGTPR